MNLESVSAFEDVIGDLKQKDVVARHAIRITTLTDEMDDLKG